MTTVIGFARAHPYIVGFAITAALLLAAVAIDPTVKYQAGMGVIGAFVIGTLIRWMLPQAAQEEE